jgi:hypothetical protein
LTCQCLYGSKNTRYDLGAEPYEPRAFALLTSNRWSAPGTLKILHVSSTNEVAVSQKQDAAGWHVQAQCLEPTIRTLDSVASCVVTQDSRTERDAAECQERVCAPSGRCVSTVTSDANAGLWHGFSRLNPGSSAIDVWQYRLRATFSSPPRIAHQGRRPHAASAGWPHSS